MHERGCLETHTVLTSLISPVMSTDRPSPSMGIFLFTLKHQNKIRSSQKVQIIAKQMARLVICFWPSFHREIVFLRFFSSFQLGKI